MSIPLRIPGNGYTSLGYTVERLADGTHWDGTKFVATTDGNYPPPIAIPQGQGIYKSGFILNLDTTNAAEWTDGKYAVFYHKMDSLAFVGVDLFEYRLADPVSFLGSGFAIAIPVR
jgi:hypothetical protein